MSAATAEKAGAGEAKSLADVAKVSELKDLGWTVEGEGKEYFAHETDGDLRTVGPASSIKALYTQVKLAAGVPGASPSGDDEDEPGRDPKKVKVGGQSLLPGTEDAVLEDMRNAILGYRRTTMDILALQERQKEEKALVTKLMHKFEDELQVDPESGNKFFQVEMVIAELEVETKEVLKTRTVKD